MNRDLQQQLRLIAARLELGKDDAVARARAEDDLRVLCCRSAAHGLRSAWRAMLWACAYAVGAIRLQLRAGDRKGPALR